MLLLNQIYREGEPGRWFYNF